MFTWRKSSYSGTETDCVEVGWHKSSYSGGETDCVEVGWRKSSYSGNETNCVEVAAASTVGVRDTKARHLGHLSVSRTAWEAFTSEISVVQPAREHRG